MSTPYDPAQKPALGPTDPNRLQLSQRGREILAQRAEEERRKREDAERARREAEEIERRKAAELDRAESAKGASFRINLRDLAATDFDREVFRLIQEGKDPADALAIASAKESRRALEAEGKLFLGETLYHTPGEVRGFSDFIHARPAPLEPPPADRDILADINQNLGDTDMLLSYAISRNQLGQVTEISYAVHDTSRDIPLSGFGGRTANQLATELFMLNIRAREAAMAQNVRAGYEAFESAERFRRETENADFSAGYPAQRVGLRPLSLFAFEEHGDTGFIGTVKIVDEKGQAPPYGPGSIRNEKQVYTGSAPFVEIPETDDPLRGFSAYYENLGEFGASGAGRLREAKYQPEVEGAAFSALYNVGERFFTGKPKELQLTLAAKEFGEIGQAIQERPGYFAGSIAASALFTVGTLGFGKAANLARAGAVAVQSRRIEKALEPLVKAGAKLEEPIKITVEKGGWLNIGTESQKSLFGVGRVTPRGKVELFMRETPANLAKTDLLVPQKRVTVYTRPAAKVTTIAGEQLVDVGKLPKKLPDNLARVGDDILEKVQVLEGKEPVFLKVPQEAKPVAVSQEFAIKDLAKIDPGKFFQIEKTGLRVQGKGPRTAMKPLDLTPAEQVTKQTVKDILPKVEPSAAKAAQVGKAATAARPAAALSRKSLDVDVGAEILTIPPGIKGAVRNLMGTIEVQGPKGDPSKAIKIELDTTGRITQKARQTRIAKGGIMPKVALPTVESQKTARKVGQPHATSPRQVEIAMPKLDQPVIPRQLTTPRQTTTIIPRLIPPTRTPTPTTRPPTTLLPRLGAERHTKGKSQLIPGFNLLIKKKGKFVKVNTKSLSRAEAILTGESITDTSAARTFKLVPAGVIEYTGQPLDTSVSDKYRLPIKHGRPVKEPLGHETYVEKTAFAIDAKGEKSEITFKGSGLTLFPRHKKNRFNPFPKAKKGGKLRLI